MKCPFCQSPETKVVDKRDSDGVTRRRRECLKCEERFTTHEHVELDLNVVKKDGRREKFDRDKLRRGIDRAFEKRKITSEQKENFASDVEARIYRSSKNKEISTVKIGEIIMGKLKGVDKVAYIRFASVYREFADADDFNVLIKSFDLQQKGSQKLNSSFSRK